MDKNILLKIAYDGAGFHGWQRQPDKRTVQGHLETVLSRLFKTEILLNGTSRTDAGVHALGPVSYTHLGLLEPLLLYTLPLRQGQGNSAAKDEKMGGSREDVYKRQTKDRAQVVVEGLYQDLERRIVASPPGQCPVDMAESFLKLCHAQSCGKCVPCRVGIGQLLKILDDILDLNKEKSMGQLELLRRTATVIKESADCAIGTEAVSYTHLDVYKRQSSRCRTWH